MHTPPAPPSPPEHTATEGLLLFAHGARDPLWAQPFQAVAQACRQRLGADRVALAFLEFMTPDLLHAGDALAAAGCLQVRLLPLFLGAGGHVRKDIPLLLEQLRQRHPHLDWQLLPAVGEAPELIAAMTDVALKARPV